MNRWEQKHRRWDDAPPSIAREVAGIIVCFAVCFAAGVALLLTHP